MINMRAFVKTAARRIFAMALAMSMMPGVLLTEDVLAAAQSAQSEAAQQKTAVTQNGETLGTQAESAVNWVETGVDGSEDPTLDPLPPELFAPQSGDNISQVDDKLYTLTVATGVKAGSSVEYFAVRYKDDDGVAQTKYIFPKTHSYQATFDYYDKFLNNSGSAARHFTDTASGNSINFNSREMESINEKKDTILTDFGYSRNKENSATALKSWSVDEFFFRAENGLSEVTGIEAFISKGSWTIQGVTVSQVTEIGGRCEYGFYSGQYFLALGKKRISELKGKQSGAATINAKNDTLVNVGGKGSAFFSLSKPNEKKAVSSSSQSHLYSFRFDFADKEGAGIESLLKKTIKKNDDPIGEGVDESLAVEIEYIDVNGWTRSITMPVLLSVLGQYKLANDSVRTVGIAQSGDTIAFTGCLPEFSSLASARQYVGKTALDKLKKTSGLEYTIAISKRISNNPTQYSDDDISLSGFSVYEGTCRMSNTGDGTDIVTGEYLKSYSYGYTFSSADPLSYFTTTKADGYKINVNTSDKLEIKKFKTGDKIIGASGVSGDFLIALRTDDKKNAGTDGRISVRLKYQDTQGKNKQSKMLDTKAMSGDFYGGWSNTKGTVNDFGYTYGVSPGNTLEIPVTLDDVLTITSLDITLERGADEWSCGGVAVYTLDKIGKKRIYAQDISANGDSSEYRIVRTLDKTLLPPFPLAVDRLIQGGDDYDFPVGKGVVVDNNEIDYNSMRYAMTYQQTKLNLGFIKKKKIYDIAVRVADDARTANDNGDSGSVNKFYFQLVFKNGSSAFVLANQQLSADGFRSGVTENFSIAVNRDYSDVVAVRVIPEDVSEDSEIFDKLNIDNITITENAAGGTSVQYVVDPVGWIDIDYYDSAEDKSVKGRSGRTMLELSKRYNVSYKKNVVNLECEITAQPWDSTYEDLQASVSCEVEYIDTNDQPQTISFDLIKRLYEYMNHTPISYEIPKDSEYAELYMNMNTVSDPRYMLRPNTTDRFLMPALPDLKTIKRMTLTATSRTTKPGKWVIGGVSISRVLSDNGTLSLTSDGEYERDMELEDFVSNESSEYKNELYLPAGIPESITIDFPDNKVTWSEDRSWTTAVSRMPDSTNDSLNIYVFPKAGIDDIEGTSVKVTAQYDIAYSKVLQVKKSNMKIYGSGTADSMYYLIGMSASGIQNLSAIGIQCRKSSIVFDYALVEHVRDGVVMNTYYFNLGNSSAVLGLSAKPDSSTPVYQPNHQKLMLSFGESTKEMTLFTKDNDNNIAVAIKYRSALDKSKNEYYSPYVYLTDAGINKVSPGLFAEIPFDIPYVREITGYKIISFGNIKSSVDMAAVENYDYSEKNTDEDGNAVYEGLTLKKAYSINKSVDVINIVQESGVTKKGTTGAGSVTPVSMIFKTAKAVEDNDTGEDLIPIIDDNKIEATITYRNDSNGKETKEIKDLRKYIQNEDSKQFIPGKPVTTKFFLHDFEKIESITLNPKNADGNAVWALESIDGNIASRMINSEINQSSKGTTISLKDVKLTTTVQADGEYLGGVTDHEMGITLTGGKSAIFVPTVKGDESGFDVKATWKVNDTESDVTTKTLTYAADGRVRFEAPVNNSAVPDVYVVTFSAKDNPYIRDVITITVPVKEQAARSGGQTAGAADGSSTSDSTKTIDAPAADSKSAADSKTDDSKASDESEAAADSTDSTDSSDSNIIDEPASVNAGEESE